MPAWPGGPCPRCGEDMPPAMIRCRQCRALLNEDLEPDSVEIPAFVPLQEITAMIELHPRGHFILCPSCRKELKINLKFAGETVSCKHCEGRFTFEPNSAGAETVAVYGDCPHCQEFLRIGAKYSGMKVACKHCTGRIQLV